jgi:dihydroxyacetone kinase-like predicted kinase
MRRATDEWKKWYAALRNANESAYEQAIRYSEGTILNNHSEEISHKFAADIEFSHVMLACELLGIRPEKERCDG